MDIKDVRKTIINSSMVNASKNIKSTLPQIKKIDTTISDQVFESIRKQNAERYQRELEDNENLKRIAAATQDINTKFDYIANDMDYILSSLGANFQRVEQLGAEEKETLDKILLALQYKNQGDGKSKIRDAIENKSIDVVLNAVIAYIQLKMYGN